ncbi:hypothetical protein CWI39_0018p0050 [Hamiltosporidium magnivora]|uniref:C3H1-type domain-containing protein n=1 Tax=Hamiltosporidium magnivora TaxID=148818 RepID=A0A4Q9LPL4_9MICR|nr:hypothetical protein CWI36_0054p0060 [Hamiltosporidium magnivora]TBU09300.1 hypothetical protein CWI36_0042p0060 [Hamiltosporidium magnivora]TBU09924.1 hypothetical protein CWI39_0018p0050 [Hamiltosporidium magnivora]
MEVPTRLNKEYLLKYRSYKSLNIIIKDEYIEDLNDIQSSTKKFSKSTSSVANKIISKEKSLLNFSKNDENICDQEYLIVSEEESGEITNINLNKRKNKDDHISKKIQDTDTKKKNVNYRTQICKFFISNSCTRGDECTFSHDTSKFPCRAYHLRNSCTRKICLFSHKPISLEELKRMKDEEEGDVSEAINFISPLTNEKSQ